MIEPDPSHFLLPLERLPDPLPIPTPPRPFDATIRPPGSKSLTNRAVLLAALAAGESVLRGALLDADDARVMIDALRLLGADIDEGSDGTLTIRGVGGRWKPRAAAGRVTLNLRNAGTATRFLAAASLLAPPGCEIVIDGDVRMRERPIGELVDALNAIEGPGTATYLARAGFPPVLVRAADQASRGQRAFRFGRTQSSQFVSALMLIGPFVPGGFRAEFGGDITSEPYVRMTAELLLRLGAKVIDEMPVAISIMPDGTTTGLAGFEQTIEPDASGASYWMAAAAIFPGGRVRLPRVDIRRGRSTQGDAGFAGLLEGMGSDVDRRQGETVVTAGRQPLRSIDADLSDMPDTAMTLAAACCFADGRSTLRGLRTLRVKETDRIEAIAAELAKIGAKVDTFIDGDDEGITIIPPPPSGGQRAPAPVNFDTYNDHRMAMSLALVGLQRPNVSIRNPACVAKTYPTFWQDFARLYR